MSEKLIYLNNQERKQESLQGLEALDALPPLPEDVVPREVCFAVLQAAASVGKQLHEATGGVLEKAPAGEGHTPETFEEMLDPAIGTFFQRAQKLWIKPNDPKQTIEVMRALQVDEFQKMAVAFRLLLVKLSHKDQKLGENNYFLKDTSLNSLLDFATNKTTANEMIHLIGAAYSAFIVTTLDGGSAFLGLNFAIFLLNTYCVLAQRYTRARLTLAINRALEQQKYFDATAYENTLGLRLPH